MKERRRLIVLFVFLGLWLLAVVARAFYLAGPGREAAIQAGEKIARQEGTIPAPRGRIVDCNRVPLAWTERYFDLYWIGNEGDLPNEDEWKILAELLPAARLPERHGVEPFQLIYRQLAVSEVLKLEPVVKQSSRLKILSRLERITVNSPAVRRLLGKVEERDGVLCGISGLELKYDARLRGAAGRFEVLLDRYRHWMERSWKLLAEPIPGEDVQLNESVTELEKRGE